MKNCKYLIFFAAISMSLIHEGISRQCFKCKSDKRDSNCGYPTNTNGVEVEECPTKDSKCFHYDYNVDADTTYKQFVQRGCMIATSNVCPVEPLESQTVTYQCKMCHEDVCNKEGTMLKVKHNEPKGDGGEPDGGASVSPTFIAFGVTLLIFIKNVF